MIESLTAEDRANTLKIASQRIETALLALEAFDMKQAGEALSDAQQSDRRLLVDVAAQLVWEYVVQREMSGLNDHREARRRYRIPTDVWSRMGATPRAA